MPIDMPQGGVADVEFGLETNTATFTSPLNNATQRLLLGGARWAATYTLRRFKRGQEGEWKAFLLRLEGGVNTFNAYDPDCVHPRGQALGSPLVKGSGQTGSTLATDGWAASVQGQLLPGDYFSCNGELKMVTGPVDSDGSGNATIPFKPAWRNSPPDNAPLTLVKATCAMALRDDGQAMWRADAAGVYEQKTFTAVEVFS